MFHILTCADSTFYPFALRLAKNLRLFPDCRLYLYDLGLRDTERRALEQLGVRLEKLAFTENVFAMNSDNNIRATHKMDCIEHFLHTYKQGVLVLDADILVIEPVFASLNPRADDIVVTYRCDREKKEHIMSNGKINTGVMAFGSAVDHAFFERWRKLCEDKEQTDQSALSLMLDSGVDWNRHNERQPFMGCQVRIMDGNDYNDTTCRIGKIFHCKSVGRRLNKKIGYWLLCLLQQIFPVWVQNMVAYNRKQRLFVWKTKKVQ
ncbi:MAG: hypothetical protein RRY20_01735 [Bilophila sp.]